jgi:hypothetical protein
MERLIRGREAQEWPGRRGRNERRNAEERNIFGYLLNPLLRRSESVIGCCLKLH